MESEDFSGGLIGGLMDDGYIYDHEVHAVPHMLLPGMERATPPFDPDSPGEKAVASAPSRVWRCLDASHGSDSAGPCERCAPRLFAAPTRPSTRNSCQRAIAAAILCLCLRHCAARYARAAGLLRREGIVSLRFFAAVVG